VKEKTVTDAVVTKVREVCGAYMDPEALLPIAKKALTDAHAGDTEDSRIQWIQSRIEIMTGGIDKIYMDRLAGIAISYKILSKDRVTKAAKEQRSLFKGVLYGLELAGKIAPATQDVLYTFFMED
jgi:hypothetical protein